MNHHYPQHSPHGPKKRILIVENDQDLIDVYSTRLEVEGFAVASLKDGKRVYQKVVEFKPDVVLLDIRLGSYDGLDILEGLRGRPETRNTKVIIITVLAVDTVEERARKLGVLEYLIKTTTVLADIVEHIKEHLGMVSPLEEEMLEETVSHAR
jgi:CheY-like chemotaxis protein